MIFNKHKFIIMEGEEKRIAVQTSSNFSNPWMYYMYNVCQVSLFSITYHHLKKPHYL